MVPKVFGPLKLYYNVIILSAAAWQDGTLTEMSDTSQVIPLSKLTPRMEQYLSDIETSKQVTPSIINSNAHDRITIVLKVIILSLSDTKAAIPTP